MSKSIYSLVLNDDIIAEIDRLAYNAATSRSGIVNKILAEFVSYTTPEQRTRDVFARVESMLVPNDVFQVLFAPSDTMFSLRSALSYKYNPSVRYSIEMYKHTTDKLGELRVSIRSKNSALLLCVLQFFKLWAGMESTYCENAGYTIDDGKFVRTLVLRGAQIGDTEIVGTAIAEYINALDTAMKIFFEYIDNPNEAIANVKAVYANYLATNKVTM